MRRQLSRQLSTCGTHPLSTLLMRPDQATTASSATLWRLSTSETGVTLCELTGQLKWQLSLHEQEQSAQQPAVEAKSGSADVSATAWWLCAGQAQI